MFTEISLVKNDQRQEAIELNEHYNFLYLLYGKIKQNQIPMDNNCYWKQINPPFIHIMYNTGIKRSTTHHSYYLSTWSERTAFGKFRVSEGPASSIGPRGTLCARRVHGT